MDEYKIIGIDPGLKSTGYGIVTVIEKKVFYIASGKITTNPKDEESVRLKEIFQGISEIVSKFQPSMAVVEKIFVNINAGTLTVNATSSNISTPAGGTSFTIQARGSAIIVWSATAAKWFMVSTDLSNTTVTST